MLNRSPVSVFRTAILIADLEPSTTTNFLPLLTAVYIRLRYSSM